MQYANELRLCQVKSSRALKNYLALSRLHRFQKTITQIFLYVHYVSNRCHHFIIRVIRDF